VSICTYIYIYICIFEIYIYMCKFNTILVLFISESERFIV
jgi:hypothetical protein